MSDFFIGQVMLAGFSFAPRYFAQCNGQLLPINQNQALFSLLGTQFGGNGTTNFALPDLRGRTPVGYASSVDPAWQPASVQMGQAAGTETIVLTASQMPAHGHPVAAASAAGNSRSPAGRMYATSAASSGAATPLYAPSGGTAVPMSAQSVGAVGGNQAHPNVQPYTTLNFCIALSGIFPSRN